MEDILKLRLLDVARGEFEADQLDDARNLVCQYETSMSRVAGSGQHERHDELVNADLVWIILLRDQLHDSVQGA
jgi:hypothetical protein